MSAKTYIVAVSGGVDSVVLLHKLVTTSSRVSLVVAHFDHGIRPDSSDDAKFVAALARRHGLVYESERVELEVGVSEEVARTLRYKFLRAMKSKHGAEAIITAHHQDDVLESMVIGLLRKSGARSVVGFSASDVLRPFLDKPKAEILEYAKDHGLTWHEDSTNEDEAYLRNYTRKRLLPELQPVREELLAIRNQLQKTIAEREILAKHLLVQMMKGGELNRLSILHLPYNVQKEVVAQWLKLSGVVVHPGMITRATLAVKLMKTGKKLELDKNTTLFSLKSSLLLKVELGSV